jgi:hypothetical protein
MASDSHDTSARVGRDTERSASRTVVWRSALYERLAHLAGYPSDTGAPLVYESRPRANGRPCEPGRVLDTRILGPQVPRVVCLGIAFRLQGRYYIGNPPIRFVGHTSITLHRLVYTCVHGVVPPRHEIHHRDGNTYNTDATNLEAVPQYQHRSAHKSTSRYPCQCVICGATFGGYQRWSTTCSVSCRRARHAADERARRACLRSGH